MAETSPTKQIREKVLELQVDIFLEDLCRQGVHRIKSEGIHDVRVNLQTLMVQMKSVRHAYPKGVTFHDLEVSEFGRYKKILDTVNEGLSRDFYTI